MARSIKLVVEVDGGQHGDEIDRNRTLFLQSQGYRVIRFWNNDVMDNLEGVTEEIARVIADMPSPDPSRMREGRH